MDDMVTERSKTDPSHEDAVIFYLSWFNLLLQLPPKQTLDAMIALFSYAFYGQDIKSFGLPPLVESILLTFIPVIDSNRMKRHNGAKGGAFGYLGGRPRNPAGVSTKNPNINITKNEKENVSGDDTVTANTSAIPDVESSHIPSHTDPIFFLFVFFFRNLKDPMRQAEKFVTYYTSTGWRLGGGDYVATDERRIALAKMWAVKDDPLGRFKPEDLAMWNALYDIAPSQIKSQMLGDDIKFEKAEKAHIRCPESVKDWIEANPHLTLKILKKWVTPCKGIVYHTQ